MAKIKVSGFASLFRVVLALMEGSSEESIRSRSVVLSGGYEGRPFFREDFLEGLTGILGIVKDEVICFGPLNRNSEWYLTLRTEVGKNAMLNAGLVKAKGYTFRIRSADRSQFRVRVHWAPPFVPNEAITNILTKHGKVHGISFEKSISKGFEGVATGVRSLIMSGCKNEIPHIITSCNRKTGESIEMLCTITGRKPMCLKCRMVGHFRNVCTTPFCRHHGVYGHSTEECVTASTYAGAVGRVNGDPVLDGGDEVTEDMETKDEFDRGTVALMGEDCEVGTIATGPRENETEAVLTDVEAGAQTRESSAEVKTIDAGATDTTATIELASGCENGVPGKETDKERGQVTLVEASPTELPAMLVEDELNPEGDVPPSEAWQVVDRVHKRKRQKMPTVAAPELQDEPNFGPLVIVEESDSEQEGNQKKKCPDSGSE